MKNALTLCLTLFGAGFIYFVEYRGYLKPQNTLDMFVGIITWVLLLVSLVLGFYVELNSDKKKEKSLTKIIMKSTILSLGWYLVFLLIGIYLFKLILILTRLISPFLVFNVFFSFGLTLFLIFKIFTKSRFVRKVSRHIWKL